MIRYLEWLSVVCVTAGAALCFIGFIAIIYLFYMNFKDR